MKRFIGPLRTGVIVTAVAVLIWVWAEGESLRTESQTATVEFVDPEDSDIVARVRDSGWQPQVRIRLEGATRAIDRAQRKLRELIKLEPGVGAVPSDPGEHVINLISALRDHPALRDTGATVIGADPEQVRIEVFRMVNVELQVASKFPIGVELEGEPVITPPSISIRVPEQVREQLTDSVATATIDDAAIRQAQPGRNSTAKVLIAIPEFAQGDTVTILKRQVEVTFKIRSRLAETTISNVPVWITLPPSAMTRFQVIPDGELFLVDVRVKGPKELIEQIDQKLLPVKAFVELTGEELERGITEKAAGFSNLPSTLEFLVDEPVVRFRIERLPPATSRNGVE